jgi:hypothetical protein
LLSKPSTQSETSNHSSWIISAAKSKPIDWNVCVLNIVKKREKIGDYIKDQLSTRESVNFPTGNGFVTYANCILDPNRNASKSAYEATRFEVLINRYL